MKTKKLIELLQATDPSGELECCIGNCDIHLVSADPAYWDGTLQVLDRDEDNEYYNIIGAKYIDSGVKVVIRPLSITDAICNDVDLQVDYSALGSAQRKKSYKESNDKTRKQMRQIEHDNELYLFLEWANKKAIEIAADDGFTLKEVATIFFEANYSRGTPMPEYITAFTTTDKDGHVWHESYAGKRRMQWEREVSISYDGMDWKIEKTNITKEL